MLGGVKFFAAVCLLALAACAGSTVAWHGTVIDPPRQAAPLEGRDQNGAPFALTSLRGTPAAVYFGFTRCKDVCPQTLALLQRARERAGLRQDEAKIVFVSVDPRHDTPATMRAYLAHRALSAIGIVGTQAQAVSAESGYGVAVKPHGDDLLHGDFIYMIDKGGRLRELLHPYSTLADISADWKALAR